MSATGSSWWNGLILRKDDPVMLHACNACNCIGPQNGAPACPCMMPEHNRRKMADLALEILTRRPKPRVRVKCGREIVQ